MTMKKLRLAIFASGNGSNAEAIIKHLLNSATVEVSRIYSNNKDAYVIVRGKKFNISTDIFNKIEFTSQEFSETLLNKKYDLIILAGFMWLVPPSIVASYKNKIINIHPALLPAYGGKGMYGDNVHQAVIENNENESGITIHYVNEYYDEGDIIFQTKCTVLNTDTPDSLAERIHKLEHQHYPKVIEKLCAEIL